MSQFKIVCQKPRGHFCIEGKDGNLLEDADGHTLQFGSWDEADSYLSENLADESPPCQDCGKDYQEPVIMNTNILTLAEYTTDRERAEELGICIRCLWLRRKGLPALIREAVYRKRKDKHGQQVECDCCGLSPKELEDLFQKAQSVC